MQKNNKIACLLVTGIAVYYIYRYSKLSSEKKSAIWVSLKETGKKIVGNVVPNDFKDKLAKKDSIDSHPAYGKTFA